MLLTYCFLTDRSSAAHIPGRRQARVEHPNVRLQLLLRQDHLQQVPVRRVLPAVGPASVQPSVR